MKKSIVTLIFTVVLCPIWAETAALVIQTQSQGEIQVPIATIRTINYDKTGGTAMYITTIDGTQTYVLSDILRMSLSGVPVLSALPKITDKNTTAAQKVLINGVPYLIQDKRVFTLKGEQLQWLNE